MGIKQTKETLSILHGVDFIVATVLNGLIILAFIRSKKLKKVTTSIFIFVLSIINLIHLFGVSLVWFINFIFSLNLETHSWTWCKINFFIQMFTFQWFSFNFVSIPINLFLCTISVKIRLKYSTSKNIFIYVIILGIISVLLNIPVLFLDDLRGVGHNSSNEEQSNLICLAPFASNTYFNLTLTVNLHIFLK